MPWAGLNGIIGSSIVKSTGKELLESVLGNMGVLAEGVASGAWLSGVRPRLLSSLIYIFLDRCYRLPVLI